VAVVDASSSSASPPLQLPSRSAESSDAAADEDGVVGEPVQQEAVVVSDEDRGDDAAPSSPSPVACRLSSSAFFLVRVLQKFLISLSVRPGRLLAMRDHLVPHCAWSCTMRRSSSAVMRPRRSPGWR
jgi:hypothetical protein